MIRLSDGISSVRHAIIFAITSCFARFIHFGHLVFSLHYISCSSIVLPVAAAHGGLTSSLCSILLYIAYKSISIGISHSLVLYHIPSFLASIYWNNSSRILRAILPLLCMILFIVHPIGSSIWYYSLYWIIPMTLSAIAPETPLYRAFASSFALHACGSVLWIYCLEVPAQAWISVMPLVLFERTLVACGMLAVHYSYSYLSQTMDRTEQESIAISTTL